MCVCVRACVCVSVMSVKRTADFLLAKLQTLQPDVLLRLSN